MHQTKLKGHFRSDFHAAFFELLLHQLLVQTGYAVEVEPEISHSTKRPDFLATKGPTRFYLEAGVATDKTDEERRADAAEDAFVGEINKNLSSPNFFVGIRELRIPSGKCPSAKTIIRALEAHLNQLDPDLVTQQLAVSGLDNLPSWKYKDENVTLEIEPVPKSAAARGKPGLRAVGIYPVRSRWGGTDRALRNKLSDKTGKYGRLDYPYLIAINSISEWGTERSEIVESLFGSEHLVVRPHEEVQSGRARDGVFVGPSGPRNTRVSAVLVATAYAWALPKAQVELFHHPWAAKPLLTDVLPVHQVVLEGERLVDKIGQPIHRVFGLADDCPTGPLTDDE